MSHTVGSPHQRSEKLRIYRAIPEGSARAKTQAQWLRALDDVADYATLRADAARNIRAIVWVISSHAHWHTLVSIPGWSTIADRTGLSESTINRAIRRLRAWGLLGVVATGSTWRTRGGRPDDDQGDLGAEYVLCVPAQKPVEISDRPSLLRQEERSKPHVRARENAPETAERPWPMTRPAATRQDRLQLAKRLQAEASMLRRITPQLLRHVLRPQLTAGWTVADLLYALDHNPDGQPHWQTSDVRHVAAWIRHRLKPWAGHQPPKPVGARQSTMLSAADIAALPRPTDPPEADVNAHASLARRLLAGTQKRSDKKPRLGLGVNLPDAGGRQALVSEPVRPVERVTDGDWLLRNAAARARTASDMPGRVVA